MDVIQSRMIFCKLDGCFIVVNTPNELGAIRVTVVPAHGTVPWPVCALLLRDARLDQLHIGRHVTGHTDPTAS
jgi:hypothetical protein